MSFAPAAVAADGVPSAPEPEGSPRAWARHTPVPILVYHHVQGYLAGSIYMYVSTSQFAAQLRYLRRHGYEPVTMQQVWDDWTGKADLPRRPVVLSFDDGYPNQYFNAARQLRKYQWPAVLNLVAHRGTALSNTQVSCPIRPKPITAQLSPRRRSACRTPCMAIAPRVL